MLATYPDLMRLLFATIRSSYSLRFDDPVIHLVQRWLLLVGVGIAVVAGGLSGAGIAFVTEAE